MKRIIKETLQNGKVQYRVESNRMFFGLIPCGWYTCSTMYISNSGVEVSCDAVFDTLREAQIHCGIDPNPIIEREIVSEC